MKIEFVVGFLLGTAIVVGIINIISFFLNRKKKQLEKQIRDHMTEVRFRYDQRNRGH